MVWWRIFLLGRTYNPLPKLMLPSLALSRGKPKWLINWDWGGGERARVRDKNSEGTKTEITKHFSDVASQY